MDPRGSKIGGAETFVRGLIRYAPRDFEVELIGVSAQGPTAEELWLTEGSVRYKFRPLSRVADENRRGFVPLSLRFTRALRAIRADLGDRVLFFNRIEPAILFRGSLPRRIVAIHNDVPNQIVAGTGEVAWRHCPWLYLALEKRCLASADLVVSESRATVEHCRRRYAALRDRIEFLPLWVEPEVFAPPADRSAEKRRLLDQYPALRAAGDVVLFTGRFQRQKAPRRLIDALELVRRKRPGTTLLLIGDGDLRPAMERWVADRGLQNAVVFLRSMTRADLPAFYRAADVFLLASDYEGMPMSVLEALACGLPVASTPVGEIPSLLASGDNGELAADRSAETLAAALDRILSNRARYPAASCAASVRAFAPHAVLGPLYDHIRRLADHGARGTIR